MNLCEVKISYEPLYKVSELPKISSSNNAVEYMRKFWEDIQHVEKAYIILLSRANRILGYKLISQGGLSGTVIDPKIVFQAALKANASAIILAHNHPSGNLKASKADEQITKKIKQGSKILDLVFFDHIIITKDNYFSFADENLLI